MASYSVDSFLPALSRPILDKPWLVKYGNYMTLIFATSIWVSLLAVTGAMTDPLTLTIAAISALAGALTMLYWQIINQHKRAADLADQDRKDFQAERKEYRELLETRDELYRQMLEKQIKMTEQTLEILSKRNNVF